MLDSAVDQALVLALVVEPITSVPVASLTASEVSGNCNIPIARICGDSYNSWEILEETLSQEGQVRRKEIKGNGFCANMCFWAFCFVCFSGLLCLLPMFTGNTNAAVLPMEPMCSFGIFVHTAA